MQHALTKSLCLLVMSLLAVPALAVVNGEAPAEDDKRFDAVGAFSKTQWLTDTPRNNNAHNWYGAAVLVAPDVVLTARHLLPPNIRNGQSQGEGQLMIRFRRHTDGTLGSRDRGPDSYHQVPVMRWVQFDRGDLALGILAKPVEHIEPAALLLDDEELVEARRCTLAGWGSTSHWQGNKQPRPGLRVGDNTATRMRMVIRIDSYQTETREAENGQRRRYVIDDNAVPNMHDSGGSIFLYDEDGKPILAGIISSYTAGTYLPAAAEAGFPLKAATEGARALVDAIADAPAEP